MDKLIDKNTGGFQVDPFWAGVREVGIFQVGTPEVSPEKSGVSQVSSLQVGLTEVAYCKKASWRHASAKFGPRSPGTALLGVSASVGRES